MPTTNHAFTQFFSYLIPLVQNAFEVDDDLKIQILDRAVKQYAYFTIGFDQLADGEIDFNQQSEDENFLYFISKNHLEAVLSLSELFPPKSNFWKDLDYYSKQYFDALIAEKKYSQTKPNFRIDEYNKICITKHALAFIPLLGMNHLYAAQQPINDILQIFEHTFIGIQLSDDIDDFVKDQHSGQWNYLQAKTDELIAQENLQKDDSENFRQKVFYVSGLAVEMTQEAINHFEAAQRACENLGLTDLAQWLTHTLASSHHNLNIAKQMAE